MTSTLTPVRKRSALTKGQLPKYAPYVVLGVALVLGAAILALIGFNPPSCSLLDWSGGAPLLRGRARPRTSWPPAWWWAPSWWHCSR